MAEDWDTLEGATHDFLTPTYELVQVLLEEAVQPRTLDELHSKVDLTDVDLSEDWEEFAVHYRGYLVCIALSLLLLLTLIIGGIIFCCCRCCPCCCCFKSSPNNHRADKTTCPQVCCALVFILLLAAMAMGVVIMSVSNPVLVDEMREHKLYEEVHSSAVQIERFIADTMDRVENTALETYANMQTSVMDMLYAIPEMVMVALEAATGAMNLLRSQREYFAMIGSHSEQIDADIIHLEQDAGYLETELALLKTNITLLLPTCEYQDQCTMILQGLAISANYQLLSNFSDVSTEAHEVEQSISDTEEDVKNMEEDISNQLEPSVTGIENALQNGYDGLSDFMYETQKKTELGLVNEVEEYGDTDFKEAFDNFWEAWFYCVIGLGVILSLLVFLYLLGLCCGCFMDRPRTGGKSKASCLLMASVYLSLIFSVIVAVISIIMLVLGGLLHTELCRYFAEPVKYEPSLHTLDEIIISHTEVEVYIVNAIYTCGEDAKSLYSSLKLDEVDGINLNDTLDPETYGIPDEFTHLMDSNVRLETVNLLGPKTMTSIDAVNTTLGRKDYDTYEDVLTGNITAGNLSNIADTLEQYSSNATDIEAYRNCLDRLRTMDDFVVAMEKRHQTLLGEVYLLQGVTQEDTMNEQVEELRVAEEEVNSAGNDIVQGVVDNVASAALDVVYDVTDELGETIRYRVGDCGPLHNAAYGVLSYVCVDSLYPLNAFWFGLGWFLIFSIVGTFVACGFSSIFRPTNVVAEFRYHSNKRANTYTPSSDLYMHGGTITSPVLPDAGYQMRDIHNPVLLSFKRSGNNPGGRSREYLMETDLNESQGSAPPDYNEIYTH